MPILWIENNALSPAKQSCCPALPYFLAMYVRYSVSAADGKLRPVLRGRELQTVLSDFRTLIAGAKQFWRVLRIGPPGPKPAVIGPFGKDEVTNLDEKDRPIWIYIVQATVAAAKFGVVGDGARHVFAKHKPAIADVSSA